MVKIVLLSGGDNQIYLTLVVGDKPTCTLHDSRTGSMTFAPLGNDEERADDCPPLGE